MKNTQESPIKANKSGQLDVKTAKGGQYRAKAGKGADWDVRVVHEKSGCYTSVIKEPTFLGGKRLDGTPPSPVKGNVKPRRLVYKTGSLQQDRASQIKMVKEGIVFSSFEKLCRAIGVSSETLSEVINIASRTLARRRKEGRLHQDESERLLRIELLFNQAMEVLGGIEQARQWVMTPNLALSGKTPLQYADTEPGAREVENVLGRIEYGVFS